MAFNFLVLIPIEHLWDVMVKKKVQFTEAPPPNLQYLQICYWKLSFRYHSIPRSLMESMLRQVVIIVMADRCTTLYMIYVQGNPMIKNPNIQKSTSSGERRTTLPEKRARQYLKTLDC